MSLIRNGYKPHPTMLIGTFDEKTMLIDFDTDEADDQPPSIGEASLLIQVSYDKDDTATIGPAPSYELQSIKNLADDTAMDINNTTTTGVTVAQEITKNNRKALFMNYCGVHKDIGSYNDGIYDHLSTFGATSVCVFSNTGTRNLSWKKLSSHGYHGAWFGISRFGNQQKLCIQFAGSSYGNVGEHIYFNWPDTTTDINYLAWASVKETAVNTYELHIELHSFTDDQTDPVFVDSVTFLKTVDISASSSAIKDQYHSGLDKYNIDSHSSLVVFESRYYLGCVEGYTRTYIINELLSHYRGLDAPAPIVIEPTKYLINYSFDETIDDLSISTGSPSYYFSHMIELPASTLLSKTFADTTPLTRGDNLSMMTIRVKIYSVSDKFHVDGHGSWSFEYHHGELKVTDGVNEVIHVLSPLPSTKFNDWVVTINPTYVTFYLNGALVISKENTCVSPFASWSQFDINHNANSVNLYEQVTVELGQNWTSEKIQEEYVNNRTDFFYHESATVSHTLANDEYTSTITPVYIVEPPSYLTSTSPLAITTPNTTTSLSVENSPPIVIPNIVNRSLDIVYTLTDRTITESIVTTLYDSSDPDRSDSTYPPSITTKEFGYLNSYRVYFELNSVTQGVAEPIVEVEWSYTQDPRLTSGQFYTTVNPIASYTKVNNQAIPINSYAGSSIQLGYYEFDISDRRYIEMSAPSTTIHHIHKTGGLNIVQNNEKSIIRRLYPYLEITSTQLSSNHEIIERAFRFVEQDWTDPVSTVVFDVHVKSANFTVINTVPSKAFTVFDTSTLMPYAGYATANRFTIEFTVPVTGTLAAMSTNQTTQIIDTDDIYCELVSVNDTTFPLPIRASHPDFSYIPTLRFSESTTQVNYELRTNISINKNTDLITAFSILVTHPSNLSTIGFNDLGVSTITQTSVSSTQTRFVFAGSHFTGQDEVLMQVIVSPEGVTDDILPDELHVQIESVTLANSATNYLVNASFNPSFSYDPLSYVYLRNVTQGEKIDYDTEIISGEIRLKTRREPITALTIKVSVEPTRAGSVVAGTLQYSYGDGWSFNKTSGTLFGYPCDILTATQLPSTVAAEHLLMTFSYQHIREFEMNYVDSIFVFIDSISPSSSLLPVPDTNLSDPQFVYERDRELEVLPYSVPSPYQLVIPMNLKQSRYTEHGSSRATVWYNPNKLTYASVSTSVDEVYAFNVTGIYEGFNIGKQFEMYVNGPYLQGEIDGLVEARFNIANNVIIDNSSFAVRLDTIIPYDPLGVQIYRTVLNPFPFQADILLQGTIEEVAEGEAYDMRVDLTKFADYTMEIRYNVYFNADKLQTQTTTYGVASVPGHSVTWSSIRRFEQTYSVFITDLTTATQTFQFQVKPSSVREALSDDDWRLVDNEAIARSTLPEGVTFQVLPTINAFSFSPEFQLSAQPREWFENEIRIDVIIQKDSVGTQSFTIDVFVNADRADSAAFERGWKSGIDVGNTATITQSLNQNIAGKFANTDRYTFFFDSSSDAYFENETNPAAVFFTIKRKEAHFLLKNTDYIVEFTAYESFNETPPPYYTIQTTAEQTTMPYIEPIASISNPMLMIVSSDQHRLTFTVNTPSVTGGVTVGYTIFYKNTKIDYYGIFMKTTIASSNPADYLPTFENGYEGSKYTSFNSFFISHDFLSDTGIPYVDQSMFRIQITSATSSAGSVGFVTTPYTPVTYVNPAGYLVDVDKFQLLEMSRISELSYIQTAGSTISALRAGTRNTSRNSLMIIDRATTVTGSYGIKFASASGGQHLRVDLPTPMYDYVTDGNQFMATAIFEINTWDLTGHMELVAHQSMVGLHIVDNSGTKQGYVRFNGTRYNGAGQTVTIQSTGITAIRAMSKRTAANLYTIRIKTWRSTTGITGTFTADQDINFTIINTVSTNPTFDPVILKPEFAGTSYDWDMYYTELQLGTHTDTEFIDTLFIDQFNDYVGYGNNDIMKLDLRFDDYKTPSHPDYVTRYISGATPTYGTIGDGSRAEDIPLGDFLSKQLSQTGNQIWGSAMNVGIFIVFETSDPSVESQSLIAHGSAFATNGQFIVNRNGTQNDLSIELNNNTGQFQQQHLEQLRYGLDDRAYLYYGRVQQTTTTSSFQTITITSRLIGLNSSTDSTFTGTHNQYDTTDYDLDPFIVVGWNPLASKYGELKIGYLRYFKYISDEHIDYEIQRIRRDWSSR